MNVVDSSAWLDYFAEGNNAGSFAKLIALSADLIVPTITLYEVFKVVLREAGENAALRAIAAMQKGQVVGLEPGLAMADAKTSVKHSLPMADAIIIATAEAYGAALWTEDRHFENIPGVHCFPKN